jgi:hypothetical protein
LPRHAWRPDHVPAINCRIGALRPCKSGLLRSGQRWFDSEHDASDIQDTRQLIALLQTDEEFS